MRHFVCLISLATNMIEGRDIIHWKDGIHSFVWSTKTFLYDIWEPRYKQIKIFEYWTILVSWNLMSYIVLLLFRLPYIEKNGFELSACLISMSSLKWDMSKPSKIIIARETMHKSQQYHIPRH